MSDQTAARNDVTRITCVVHPRLGAQVTDCLVTLGAHTVLVENARSVRQRIRPRAWVLPGQQIDLENTPIELFRTTVPRESALQVIETLSRTLDLHTPGRGAVYAQEIIEYSQLEPPTLQTDEASDSTAFRDFTLITGILSKAGGGERLTESALRLGACVPIVTRGFGTGLRDQLGLLRITIPPEKELVHLMVPAHDAAGIQRLLIEDARMDRPGGGFLYQTPISAGIVDPLLRIGRQEHAASMEQLIAAMDEIKHGTGWRKRFADPEESTRDARLITKRKYCEITLVCSEGKANDFVRAAMEVGAGGATTGRIRCLSASDLEGGVGARERGVICVPTAICAPVVQALRDMSSALEDPLCRIQVLDSFSIFFHQR
jgi:nitrogen regulatory protein PII